MIVYKQWTKKRSHFRDGIKCFEGWFLFGFIPRYIRQLTEWHR